jgi:hypothetical protein
LPPSRTLAGSLEHEGVCHDVVARSVPRYLIFSKDTITVDGIELPLTHENPRGLLRAVFRAAGQGHPASLTVVGALGLLLLAVLAVGGCRPGCQSTGGRCLPSGRVGPQLRRSM